MGVSISSRSILVGVKEYILMTFGMFCYAFGWLMCVLPAGGMGGGAAGLATLINAILSNIFPDASVTGFLTIGTLVFIINCVLLILGVMIVGWKFGIKTLYCILMMSVMFNLVESFLEPDLMVNMLKGVDAWRLLLVVLGAASCGLGIAVSFMQGGSTGGTDIVAMIINKFRTVSYGKVLLMTDCGILISSVFLTTTVSIANSADLIELTTIEPMSSLAFARMIYGFIMIAVIGYTVDFVQSGNQQSNQIMIFCKDYEAMADMINTKAHRGATLIDAMGWYTKTPSKAVMVVCRKRDTSMILKLVREQDPSAFLTVGSVMGVYGQGFDALNKL